MKKHICIWLASIVMIFLTAGCSTNANNGTPNAGFKATPKPADTTSRISVAEISPAKGESTNKILVAYFSHSGNTRQIAKYIHEDVGGDIYEITPVNPYPENYDAVVARVRQERAVDARPALTAKVENMEAYNVIFVGFPNWGSDMPKPVYTFLEQYDFSGKTIIPFCTHGGGGFGISIQHLTELAPKATILDGFEISGSNVGTQKHAVDNWLHNIGITKKIANIS